LTYPTNNHLGEIEGMKVWGLMLAGWLAMVCHTTVSAAQSYDTVDVFSMSDLITALEANGASYKPRSDNRSIDVTFENGLKANGAIMACEDDETQTNCFATSILATFTMPDQATEQSINAAINEYNYRQNFGRAYLDPDGRISVRLYIISDGGIRRGNYQRQIGLWSNSLAKFVNYLFGDDS
jgi:hypothetical protein